MIKVTVGEQKTQSEKPFPKLMVGKDGKRIVYATGLKESDNDWQVLRVKGFDINDGTILNSFGLFTKGEEFTDYNEPITLQNF